MNRSFLLAAVTAAALGSAGPVSAESIAVKFNVRPQPGCAHNQVLKDAITRVMQRAEIYFQQIGHKMVSDPSKAPNRLGAVFDLMYCYIETPSGIDTAVIALGTYGVANGTSSVSTEDRPAFSYGLATSVRVADRTLKPAEQARDDISKHLQDYIYAVFKMN